VPAQFQKSVPFVGGFIFILDVWTRSGTKTAFITPPCIVGAKSFFVN